MSSTFWVNEPDIMAGKIFQNTSKPPAAAAILFCNMNGQDKFVRDEGVQRNGYGRLGDLGKASDGLIRRLTAPIRNARIWFPSEVKAGATDVSLFRVMVTAGANGAGITIRAKP